MPSKFPKPFFRTARKAWFLQVGDKQIKLGSDRDAAFRRYHELMGQPQAPPAPADARSVVGVLDAFLDWCLNHKAGRTYDWYHDYLESFARSVPPELATDKLKPYHVQQWLDANPGWKTGKRGAVIAVQRAFNWAARMGLIESNPIRSVEKPKAGRRNKVISAGRFEEILEIVKDDEFRDLLVTCWETGCRPQEAISVEARHVDLENGCWAFPVDESKGKKHLRIVYLTDAALEITRRRMAAHPSGQLFRNTDGFAWTPSALNCRFGRLRIALGRKRLDELKLVPPKLKRLKKAGRMDSTVRDAHHQAVLGRRRQIAELAMRHGPRYSLYTFRHSWCTHALERGLDAVTVATLMGHRDTTMICRVYGHLMQKRDFLREAARRAVGIVGV
jgi:integrase/recombinase XerD